MREGPRKNQAQTCVGTGPGSALRFRLEELSALLFETVLDSFYFSQGKSAQPSQEIENTISCLLQMVPEIYTSANLSHFRSRPIPKSQCETLTEKTGEILAEILKLKDILDADISAVLRQDPSTDDPLEVVLSFPGFRAIVLHRIAHIFWTKQIPLIPRFISECAHTMTGIDIHPGASIGHSFFIDHGTGVVIGETCVIGEGVSIYQGVTLGAKNFDLDAPGQVKKGYPRHPRIEDGVTIYAGATVLGKVTIGRNSVIGGNVWLTRSVEAMSQIIQQPCVAQRFKDGDGI